MVPVELLDVLLSTSSRDATLIERLTLFRSFFVFPSIFETKA